MKTKLLVSFGGLLALMLALSGCAAGLTASAWPGVAADAENAYIAAGPFVYALNQQTGAQVWSFPDKASTANPFFAAPVLTSDGQLIVGGFDKKLYSLDPQTRATNWTFTKAQDRWIGSVLVAGDTIYAPNADYKLYALSLGGSQKWAFSADQSIWGTPVTDGVNVYFGTLGHKVYAVNALTGEQAWVQSVDGAVLGTPAVDGDQTLYVGTYNGTLYAMATGNGNTRWMKKVSSWIWSGPLLDGSTVYVGDAKGVFSAFDAASGELLWSQQLNGAVIGAPALSGDSLVVATEAGNLYLISRDGQKVTPSVVAGKLYASPVPAGSLVLVAPTEGDATLVALNTAGAIKWSFKPAK